MLALIKPQQSLIEYKYFYAGFNWKHEIQYGHCCTFCFYHACLSFSSFSLSFPFFNMTCMHLSAKYFSSVSRMIVITIYITSRFVLLFYVMLDNLISSRFYSLFSAFPHFQMSRPYDEWCHLHTYSQISFRLRQIQTQQDIHPRKHSEEERAQVFTVLKLEFGCGRN